VPHQRRCHLKTITGVSEYCLKLADEEQVSKNFQMLTNLAAAWEISSKNQFVSKPQQCYMAARLFQNNQRMVYFQLQPGYGKTFTGLLLAYFYQHESAFTPVYVTIN
jgi:hypothetical protein